MRYLLLLLLLVAVPAWADFTVTIDRDGNPAASDELLVGGRCAIGGALDVTGAGTFGDSVFANYLEGRYQIILGSSDLFDATTCAASGPDTFTLYADTSENKWKKCTGGVLTDMTDTTLFDTCSELAGILTDETGTCGGVVLSQAPTITNLHGAGGPTGTPAATPTATAATPTPTGVTPTPTPTSTPPTLIDGDVLIDGDLFLRGLAPRSIKVGSCQLAPCSGKGLTISGGNAVGTKTGTGGGVTIQGGDGTNTSFSDTGGDITLNATGVGGGDVFLVGKKGGLNVRAAIHARGDLLTGLSTGGARPTLSACGTSPTINSHATNTAGLITVGTGVTTSCTVTFGGSSFNNGASAVSCVAEDTTTVASLVNASATTTVMTISTAAVTIAGDTLSYHCIGLE